MFSVGTHSSGLKLDLNVCRVNTFVEDRERKPVVAFVKFVSELGMCEYM